MALEQDTFILAKYSFNPGKTRPWLTEKLLMGRKELDFPKSVNFSFSMY